MEKRAVNTTFVCFCSVSGLYATPIFNFKGKKMCNDLKVGAPLGILLEVSEREYMSSKLFVTWFGLFFVTTKPNVRRNVLLLVG